MLIQVHSEFRGMDTTRGMVTTIANNLRVICNAYVHIRSMWGFHPTNVTQIHKIQHSIEGNYIAQELIQVGVWTLPVNMDNE